MFSALDISFTVQQSTIFLSTGSVEIENPQFPLLMLYFVLSPPRAFFSNISVSVRFLSRFSSTESITVKLFTLFLQLMSSNRFLLLVLPSLNHNAHIRDIVMFCTIPKVIVTKGKNNSGEILFYTFPRLTKNTFSCIANRLQSVNCIFVFSRVPFHSKLGIEKWLLPVNQFGSVCLYRLVILVFVTFLFLCSFLRLLCLLWSIRKSRIDSFM